MSGERGRNRSAREICYILIGRRNIGGRKGKTDTTTRGHLYKDIGVVLMGGDFWGAGWW